MKRKQTVKDYFFISLGILLYAIGFNAFILPERVVMGGMTGVSSLLYYAFNLPPGIMLWIMNVALLILAYKALSKQFVIRTIVGVTIMSFFIDALRPLFIANPIITAGEDKFMHVLIGGMMGGAGLGIVFSHNGSTGGTDILVALLGKYTRMSFGRAMQMIDMCIISSSYFLFHSTELVVYGLCFTFVAAYVCDYVINGTRQTVQFLIISKKYDEIADIVNKRMHRGVTVIQGMGWFKKSDVKLLIILTRKYESQEVFNTIKRIDPNAMVSQSFCQGVFGEGFDKIK
ncbi:MAG: YitT family protein [Prevotella sp.]|uniref:YitT family protein n=1 Tax=Prevotella sp. P5-92 TaxID=2024222 RepID=UPI0013030FF1|nr:YitT family protein [Prevotella sp. P5-92]MCI7399558.1 YitT family protein [Prevotella sp.]MDD6820696.1 YitT family protein [Prevotella sp.]MDY4653353.1 YitT family protein [Prevotella sp.]